MEYYFFVIVVIIVLKILFWTCYFYVRAQRIRQLQTTQRFLIIGTQTVARPRNHSYSDRSAIINHAEPVSATSPPPYAEVVKDGSCPPPPSYDQATAAPQASGMAAVPVNSAGPFQAGNYAGASAMPAYNPAVGSSTVAGYSPAAGQINGYPGGQPQPVGGQPATSTSMNPHTTVTIPGQNFSAPPQ
ncbi:hypothetical protein ACOMHN_032255 [Nucella lapillus]